MSMRWLDAYDNCLVGTPVATALVRSIILLFVLSTRLKHTDGVLLVSMPLVGVSLALVQVGEKELGLVFLSEVLILWHSSGLV